MKLLLPALRGCEREEFVPPGDLGNSPAASDDGSANLTDFLPAGPDCAWTSAHAPHTNTTAEVTTADRMTFDRFILSSFLA
jgi:hypothetical protein